MTRKGMTAIILGIVFFFSAWGLPNVEARRRRKKKSKIQTWTKILYSKKRFGRSVRSKRRNRWFRIKTVRPRTSLMRELLGEKIHIRCRLDRTNYFQCEGHGREGMLLVNASSQWRAGRLRIYLRVTPKGLTMEISNKWRKSRRWVREIKSKKGKRKRYRRRRTRKNSVIKSLRSNR